MPSIAVVYTHFPHYRSAVFKSLLNSEDYDFSFGYDNAGIDDTISNGMLGDKHLQLSVHKFGPFLWQSGSVSLAGRGDIDGIIFLGNPLIISTWFAVVYARFKGKKVLFWTHGWLRREDGFKKLIRNLFYDLSDMLLLYGERAKEIGVSSGFSQSKISVIYNALDYEQHRKIRDRQLSDGVAVDSFDIPSKPFFLVVSRLISSAGLDLAVEAMAHLPRGCTLVIVGEGPERHALEKQASDVNIDVHFLGAIYDEERLGPLFMATRAVVSPGKIGLLAMHALAYGVPVISHDDLDQQMPEVEAITPGVTGILFPRGEVPELVAAMKHFLDMPDSAPQRKACRASAIARIEQDFTPKAQVNKITAALDSVFREGC